jgi:hypothetical protein
LHDKVIGSGVLTEKQLSNHREALIAHLKNPYAVNRQAACSGVGAKIKTRCPVKTELHAYPRDRTCNEELFLSVDYDVKANLSFQSGTQSVE